MFISVIIPIYKTEQYLRQCVDSVLAQTFSDFELILVDDGSPDGAPVICDEYAQKDSRVKVIHKENGGLVSARQAGIEVASGEYIVNIDSDDWIEPTYFEEVKSLVDDKNPDVIAFAVNYCYPNRTETTKEIVECGFYDKENVEKTIISNMLLNDTMNHMFYFVWGKAFRKEVIKPNQLAVDKRISMGEDVACLIPTYLDANSVYVSDKAMYDCRCHDTSMSRSFNPNHFRDINLLINYLREKEKNAPKVFAEEVDRYGAFIHFVLFATAAKYGDKKVIGEAKKIWSPEVEECFNKANFKYITKKSKIALDLLKKKKFGTAYRFLRLCAIVKRG